MSTKRKRVTSSGFKTADMAEKQVSDMDVSPLGLEEMYRCSELADITKCFVNLHTNMTFEISNIKAEIKNVKKEVHEVQKSLEYTQTEVAEIQEYTIPGIYAQLEKERAERLKLDMWGRKWNAVVTGIPGTTNEDTGKTEVLVRDFFIKKLSLSTELVEDFLFQAVHRLPGGKMDKKNIIVRFLSLAERDRVLQAAQKLAPNSGHAVYIDLPPEIGKIRLNLLEKRRNMPADVKKNYKLKYYKEPPFIDLVIKKKTGNQGDPQVGMGRGRGRLRTPSSDKTEH